MCHTLWFHLQFSLRGCTLSISECKHWMRRSNSDLLLIIIYIVNYRDRNEPTSHLILIVRLSEC